MFVRKKRNRTGTISVVIVDKSKGEFREIKRFGVAHSEEEADALYTQAFMWMQEFGGQTTLDFDESHNKEQEMSVALQVLSKVETVLLNAPQMLLNRIYDDIGFNRIKDDILRHLVIARICQPMSKAATVDYLKSYFDEDVELVNIYRYMDKLYDTQRDLVQEISVEHTRKILGGHIGIVFYDCTTLYFESFIHDKLCEPGYSKDGKSKENQIVVGLLVSAGGYPLAYSVFCGSQYEGFTMIPVVEDFVKRFNLEDFVVVADSGLMSKKNLALLQSGGYKYILGARIRNESAEIREWILSLEKSERAHYERRKDTGDRLILTYSPDRAKKDADNRKRGVARLKRAFASGIIKKESLNRRGYNKFLEITRDIGITINEDKIADDERWDGWKGYITNTTLSADNVVSQYHGLWVVERAFRITKGNMEMRPIFHFTSRRIEAHICICFIAYKVYKEFERIIKERGLTISVDKVLNIAKTIPTITIKMPNCKAPVTQTLFLSEAHKSIQCLFC